MQWKMCHGTPARGKIEYTWFHAKTNSVLKRKARAIYVNGCTPWFDIYDPIGNLWQRCATVDKAGRLVWRYPKPWEYHIQEGNDDRRTTDKRTKK